MTEKKQFLPAAFALTIGGAALAAYALGVEPFLVERTETDVFLDRLPKTWNGLKILFIADMHTPSWSRREETIVKLVQTSPRPDLIVWGGDFLRGRAGIPAALRLVREVTAVFPDVPAFGILGNAEHKLNLAERRALIAHLEEIGVQMLGNENRPLTLRGETITLIGVDDPYYGHADLNQSLYNAPPATTHFCLLLAHSPQIATQAARAGVNLMLSGHTHGGQVRLPLIGPLKTQNPLCRRLDMGLFDHARLVKTLGYDPGGNLTTYITRGIGLANLPGLDWAAPRFLCRPEIALLTLKR